MGVYLCIYRIDFLFESMTNTCTCMHVINSPQIAQKGPYIFQNTIVNISRVNYFVQLTIFATPVYAR